RPECHGFADRPVELVRPEGGQPRQTRLDFLEGTRQILEGERRNRDGQAGEDVGLAALHVHFHERWHAKPGDQTVERGGLDNDGSTPAHLCEVGVTGAGLAPRRHERGDGWGPFAQPERGAPGAVTDGRLDDYDLWRTSKQGAEKPREVWL